MCCGSFAGNLAYVSEKLVSFAALTAVILCIIITLTISLGLGVGVGYNYCYVDLKIMTEEPEGSPGLLRSGDSTEIPDMPQMPEMPNNRRSFAHSTRPRRMLPIPDIRHTMAIPLNEDFDFPSLLGILRARNRNVTLELVT